MSTNNQVGNIFATVITIVVIVLVARCMFCDGSSDDPSQASKPKVEHDSIAAWIMCQQFVKDRLKAPSSADFGSAFSSNYQDPEKHAIHKGNGVYECNGFVDAQNSFGAMIRNQFRVTIKYTGKNNWRLIDGPVIQ